MQTGPCHVPEFQVCLKRVTQVIWCLMETCFTGCCPFQYDIEVFDCWMWSGVTIRCGLVKIPDFKSSKLDHGKKTIANRTRYGTFPVICYGHSYPLLPQLSQVVGEGFVLGCGLVQEFTEIWWEEDHESLPLSLVFFFLSYQATGFVGFFSSWIMYDHLFKRKCIITPNSCLDSDFQTEMWYLTVMYSIKALCQWMC